MCNMINFLFFRFIYKNLSSSILLRKVYITNIFSQQLLAAPAKTNHVRDLFIKKEVVKTNSVNGMKAIFHAMRLTREMSQVNLSNCVCLGRVQ